MYFCGNCGKVFKTGKDSEDDSDIYDDVCPDCGCYPPASFWEWLRNLPSLMIIRVQRWKERRKHLKRYKEWERVLKKQGRSGYNGKK